jgi:capsular polysaccharide biosynthesis protein
MKQRAAEILFRRKFLLLLPFVLIVPLTVLIALRPTTPQWTSSTNIWVDQYKPLYTDERLGWSPAANQAQLLTDFIRTRTFARSVLQQTSLAPMLADPRTEDQAVAELQRSVRVFPTAGSFVGVMVTTADKDLSYQIANGILTSYQQGLEARNAQQAEVTRTLYANGLKDADKKLAAARQELADYLTAHPELTRVSVGDSSLRNAQDPNLTRMTAQVSNAEQDYQIASRRYEDVQTTLTAGREGQVFSFTVVDKPEPAVAPLKSSRIGLLKLPIIGLVLALILSAAVATFLVLTNRTVLGARDIRVAHGLPILGEIPQLRRRRWLWQRAPRDAVRITLAAPARVPLDVVKGA